MIYDQIEPDYVKKKGKKNMPPALASPDRGYGEVARSDFAHQIYVMHIN